MLTGALLLLLAPQTDYELLREILRTTEPIETPRGERLPLYIWPAQSLGTTNEVELEALLREARRTRDGRPRQLEAD